jgi:predicted dehydrogenase
MHDRFLIAGLGSIGARHARIAREFMPGAMIAALRRQIPDEPAPGIDVCFTSIADALKFEPDAAVIAGPAPTHLGMALELARSGVHLLIEKPIADRADGVQELLEVAAKRRVTIMTGYNLRYLPSLMRFRELVHAGVVGRILSVRSEVGQYLPTWRPGVDYRKSVSASATLGGGVLLELSHEIDYLRWVFGEARWVSAMLSRQSELAIDVEDTAFLTIGFARPEETGTIAAALCMDFVRRDTSRVCTAIGDAGSLRWNAVTGTVERYVPADAEWRVEFQHAGERDDTYRAEWSDFVACMRSGGRPRVTGEDGLAVMHIIDAARRSSKLRCVVPIGTGTAMESEVIA